MLTAGHARTLVAADDPQRWPSGSSSSGCRCARPRSWPAVRRSSRHRGPARGRPRCGQGLGQGRQQAEKDPNVRALEEALSQALGLEVAVEDRGRAGGRAVIRYARSSSSTRSAPGCRGPVAPEVLPSSPGRAGPGSERGGPGPTLSVRRDCSLERRALPGGGRCAACTVARGLLQRRGVPEAELAAQALLALEQDGRPCGALEPDRQYPPLSHFGPETDREKPGLEPLPKGPAFRLRRRPPGGQAARAAKIVSPSKARHRAPRRGWPRRCRRIPRRYRRCRFAPAMGEQARAFRARCGRAAVGAEQVGEMVAGIVGEIETGLAT